MPKGKPHSESPSAPKYDIETRSKTRAKASYVATPRAEMSSTETVKETGRLNSYRNRAIQPTSRKPNTNPARSNKQSLKNQKQQSNGYGRVGHVERNGCYFGHCDNDANFPCLSPDIGAVKPKGHDGNGGWNRSPEATTIGKAWRPSRLCKNLQLVACERWSTQCKSS